MEHVATQQYHLKLRRPPFPTSLTNTLFLSLYLPRSAFFFFPVVVARTDPNQTDHIMLVFWLVSQAFWDVFVAFFIVFSVLEVTFRLGFDAPAEGR